MIRWLGAALLLMGSSALGVGAAARLRGRVRDIQGLTAGQAGTANVRRKSFFPLMGQGAAGNAFTFGRGRPGCFKTGGGRPGAL